MTITTKFGKKLAIILTAGGMPVEVNAVHGEAFNRFGVAGFTDSQILSFNSEKSGMDANIFSVDEDAQKIKGLAKWLAE